MHYSRGREKFGNAVRALATGRGVIQERLIDAFRFNISSLTPEDVPSDLAGELRSMQDRMTSRAAQGGEGTIAATARSMSDDEAVEMAERVLAFAYNLE